MFIKRLLRKINRFIRHSDLDGIDNFFVMYTEKWVISKRLILVIFHVWNINKNSEVVLPLYNPTFEKLRNHIIQLGFAEELDKIKVLFENMRKKLEKENKRLENTEKRE
ncbi:hypothetical protein EOM81_01685 [bacterium]|nr:hypothetical protein [bacterium]